jgi:hypothetical protein
VAIYRGATVADAKLIALTADPALVADVSEKLLTTRRILDSDSVIQKLERGRNNALRAIRAEAEDESKRAAQ